MIVDFGDRAAEDLFNRRNTKRLRRYPQDIMRRALRKLVELDSAVRFTDVAAIPGNRLEKLSGDLKGYYSVRVNEQWRIVFRWSDGNAHGVLLTDYHD